MATVLGLDIGNKRVGIALSDGGGLIAFPHQIFMRAAGRAENEILQLINSRGIKTVVAGLPLSEDGGRTPQCEKIEGFCRRLERRAGVRVVYLDEYATSAEAREKMNVAGKRSTGKDDDRAAACLILQMFLDSAING